MDKMTGGVGLRRGRTNIDSLNAGDALDFGGFYLQINEMAIYYFLLK